MIFVNRNRVIGGGKLTIRLYRYGSLYKTLTVKEGESIALGTCTSTNSDDTFYGWSISSESTTRSYDDTTKYTFTEDTDLYAIFSYTTTTTYTGVNASMNVVPTVGETYTVTGNDSVDGQILDTPIGGPNSYTVTAKKSTYNESTGLYTVTVYFKCTNFKIGGDNLMIVYTKLVETTSYRVQ